MQLISDFLKEEHPSYEVTVMILRDRKATLVNRVLSISMNELPAIGYPCYIRAKSSEIVKGQTCIASTESLEGNVLAKSCFDVKNNDFGESSAVFRQCFIANGFGYC